MPKKSKSTVTKMEYQNGTRVTHLEDASKKKTSPIRQPQTDGAQTVGTE